MKQVLVTGGAGFIGSNFIDFILDKHPDWHVTNLDNLSYAANLETVRKLSSHSQYRLVKGDVADERLVSQIMQIGFDMVFHFAAESHVDRSFVNARPFLRTNILGSWSIFEQCAKHDIERLIYCSTPEVYGHSGDKTKFQETSPLEPSNPYSATKASADLLARVWHKCYDLPIISVRFANVFGPSQYPEKLIPLAITYALRGEKIPVYGDGTQKRNWIYVVDVCDAIDKVAEKGEIGTVYNIGSEEERTNLDLVETILAKVQELTGIVGNYHFVPDRLVHDPQYPMQYDRIKEEIGWRARADFDGALKWTISWYMENPHVF